jgi:serine/threonine-protein kinase RsbW
MTLELHASPEEVMRAVATLEQVARAAAIPEKAVFGLALALEESASNIVNHALRRDPRHTFQVVLEATAGQFVIELRDRGPAFNPTAAAHRKLQAEHGDPPGGWGIALVRRYTDEISYRRESGENVLRLVKHFHGADGGQGFP